MNKEDHLTASGDLSELRLPDEPKYDPGAPNPHCSKCGKFIRLTWSPIAPGVTDDWADSTGVCKVHGKVTASWEPK